MKIKMMPIYVDGVTLLESIIYDFSVMAAESFYNSFKI